MSLDVASAEQQVARLLALAVQQRASDVHLRVGQPPMLRVAGELVPVEGMLFDREALQAVSERMVPVGLRERAAACSQFDFSAEWPGAARFRVHRFLARGDAALVLRLIPLQIPDFATLRLPPAVKRIAALERGLVLVTGATGMGKSTTIASFLDFLCKNTRQHILTIEDPVEFVIGPGTSLVSQREVGRDILDYSAGLWAALREDPDTIFLGEIRDLETVRVALQAAETGHLVLSAIHTSDATSTVEHLISLFPPEEQLAGRFRLAETLQAVLSQKLLPMKGRKSRILVTELMLRSASIQEMIRKPERLRGLAERMAQSAPDGMHTFDQELRRMLEGGLLDFEVARAAASNPADFVRNLQVT